MQAIIGIESTAHTFGIGIVREGKIVANVKDTYVTKHGGIIPTEAAKHHESLSEKIYNDAFKIARISENEIKGIAFSQGPGLSPCLLVGLKFAKKLSEKLKLPLIPVNHCVAHLEIGSSLGNKPKNPVMLYASGANTQIIAYASGKYRVFGETLDIGIGNFLDNFARYLGLGFPGGPKIEQLALKGKKYAELPYKVKGMDVSLSGILTNLKQKIESKKLSKEDLAFSAQETAFAMLVEVAERAMAHTEKKELLLGGGVGCNKRLQEMCRIMCKERNAKFFVPEKSLLVDNGAMIAYLGEIMFKSGIKFQGKKAEELDIKPRQRTDEVEVSWK
ncbi:MAG TPA: bifunctional N(6)-L-threonylcarbamoyladenine synthase/serine/threonine protein kinase [Candidatus Nanoarchaeia archaeon]|nr:bifunctional N(6)-L-threonylcarbamoyladenine synthase/serine/threonine protein kinase [Candidatus Nanoarchaeia archaeon]